MTKPIRADGSRSRGFTLIELMIALAVVAILVRIAFPSYQAYVVRSSRQAAQSELVALANAQERIFLNSNFYACSVALPYTGQSTSTSGLGVSTGKSKDGRYTLAVVSTCDVATQPQTFTLKATAIGAQAGNGDLTIEETGRQIWIRAGVNYTWDGRAM